MYEKYPGSINDVSQLQFMVEKVAKSLSANRFVSRKEPLKMIGEIRLLNSEYMEKQYTHVCI